MEVGGGGVVNVVLIFRDKIRIVFRMGFKIEDF